MHDEVGRYLFLACAVAGRRVSVHLIRGNDALACSDGQSIYVPPARAGGDVWQDVVAQAALVGVGALAPRYLRRLLGRREAARRYAYLEVRRATVVLADRLPSGFLALPDLHRALTHSADESLECALSQRALPEPPPYCGTVRPLLRLRKAISDEGVAALSRGSASGAAQQSARNAEAEGGREQGKLLRLFQNPLAGGQIWSDLFNKVVGVSAERAGEGASQIGSAETPVGSVGSMPVRGVHALRAQPPSHLPEVDVHGESGTTAYPEWDTRARRYRKDWAVVEEVEPWREDGARELAGVLTSPPRELRRQLAGLGLDHEMHRRQGEGSELDAGRLLDCAIELAAGCSPPALDVYRSSRRTRRDLAVAVALDISGSTGETDARDASVFDRQMRTAWQLGRSLSELGDSVAVFGFHSWGRNLVRAVRLKGPEERWGAHVGERFARLEALGYTRTGAAIRHGVRMLQQDMRLPNRLLLLITDGIAYDQDYESDYAEGDARKALEEARAAGTACVCLCIGGSREAEKLRGVFGAANLLIVDEPAQIVTRIRGLCRDALAAVSKRRFAAAAAL